MRRILGIYRWSAGAMLAQSEQYDFQAQPGARVALTVEKMLGGRTDDRGRKRGVQRRLAQPEGSAKDPRVHVPRPARRRAVSRITFKSTSVISTGATTLDVSGTLAVLGVERPAQVSVTSVESGGELTAVTGRAIVRLTDYPLKPPKAALGAIGPKNEMSVDLRLAPLPTSQTLKSSVGATPAC
jgi:hypothetical protein